MLGNDETTTDDPIVTDLRNFYKVELWARDGFIERILFAGMSLDQARAMFADYATCRPAARADDPAAEAGARAVAEGVTGKRRRPRR